MTIAENLNPDYSRFVGLQGVDKGLNCILYI